MKSGSKKLKGSGECIGERDFFSELPDDVIVHILSFLPTLDAVKTVLLRRFGNLWTLVPTLDFDDDDWETANGKPVFLRFSQYVHNVLVLHKRLAIDNFYLTVSQVTQNEVEVAKIAIEVSIRFAISREAKELFIDFYSDEPLFVPTCIFTSQSLDKLALEKCHIVLPRFVHMGSLRFLAFFDVIFEGRDNFNDFVSGCPRLENLVLDNSSGSRNLSFSSIKELDLRDDDPAAKWTINCPNLKKLDLCVPLEYVEVISVQSVRQLTMTRGYNSDNDTDALENAQEIKRFLEGFQNVEALILAPEVVVQLTYCSILNVGFPQNRWKRVVLRSGMQGTFIAGICSLIRNSPCLEELMVHVDLRRELDIKADSYLVYQETNFPCVARHLKLVSMCGYENPYDGQLRLIEFLLKSAVNLDTLVIFSSQGFQLTSAEEQQFVKQLSNFSRASTEAKIVFK